MKNKWTSKQWIGLLALSFAVFMVSLDITVVTVALPMIQRQFTLDFEHVQWVINAYTLSYGSLMVTCGTLADRYGRRRLFVIGLLLFAGASGACGLAVDGTSLILFRIAQGAGGAALATCSMAMVASIFQGHDRQLAYGVWATAVGLGLALGPPLGGQIVAHIDWGWVFLLNVPISAAIIVAALKFMPESCDSHAGRFDFYGFSCFAPALVLMIYALMRGGAIGWIRAIAMLILSAALFALFVVVERKRKHPLFDLRLFKVPSFVGVSLISIAASISYWSLFIYIPLYLDRVLHVNVAMIGLAMLPFTMPMLITPPFAARLSRLIAPQTQFALGLGLIGIGDFYLAMTLKTNGMLAVPLLISGIGTGLINALITHVAVSVVPPGKTGMAAGLSATMRQLGFAVGVAVLGAILSFFSHVSLLDRLKINSGFDSIDKVRVLNTFDNDLIAQFVTGLPSDIQNKFLEIAAQSFATGFQMTLFFAGSVSFITAFIAFLLIRQSDMYPVAALA